MTGIAARILGLFGCLLALSSVLPVQADPFFVRVYGRTYKIDPPSPSDAPKGSKPQDLMKALPSDLARSPGHRPSHEEVLAEIEERVWIAGSQIDGSEDGTAGTREKTTTGSVQARTPELQELSQRHRALDLLVRELRRSLDLPVRTPQAGFSRPKLTPEIEDSFRAQKFDPYAAYYGFRRVKAAFRSGDIELLARVSHYPLTVTGRVRRTIRNRDQLIAAKETIMNSAIREAVARSTFESVFVRDKGMMLGDEAAWITQDKNGFALGTVHLD